MRFTYYYFISFVTILSKMDGDNFIIEGFNFITEGRQLGPFKMLLLHLGFTTQLTSFFPLNNSAVWNLKTMLGDHVMLVQELVRESSFLRQKKIESNFSYLTSLSLWSPRHATNLTRPALLLFSKKSKSLLFSTSFRLFFFFVKRTVSLKIFF